MGTVPTLPEASQVVELVEALHDETTKALLDEEAVQVNPEQALYLNTPNFPKLVRQKPDITPRTAIAKVLATLLNNFIAVIKHSLACLGHLDRRSGIH